MAEICEVVIASYDAEWLHGLGRRLILDRLCADVRHLPPVRSFWEEDGEIKDADEARISLHTRRDYVDDVIARAEREHPKYPESVPRIMGYLISEGNAEYYEWIIDQTLNPNTGNGFFIAPDPD